MSRMEHDIAKRDSDKRVNEMKKTAEGRRVLKQLGMLPPPSKSVAVGKLGAVPRGAVRGRCLRCAQRALLRTSRACSWLTRVRLAPAGGKKSPTAQATASAILGVPPSQVSVPKIVTHKGNKLNDAKQWNSETWARSTWLF